jgi:hypothetical protein
VTLFVTTFAMAASPANLIGGGVLGTLLKIDTIVSTYAHPIRITSFELRPRRYSISPLPKMKCPHFLQPTLKLFTLRVGLLSHRRQ